MKMAKKMLAVAVVLAMVAAFAVIAFAASPSVSFSVGEYNTEKGRAKVSASFVDAVGLTSGKIKFAYADGTVTKIVTAPGADADNTGKQGNAFSSEFNPDINPAEYGFYFKENLWATSKWDEQADDLEVDAKVNGEAFEFATFTFTAPAGTEITVTGEMVVNGETVTISEKFTVGTAEVTTEKATTEKATTEKATTEKATTEKATTEKATTEKATTEKATTEEATTEKTTTTEESTTAKVTPGKTNPGNKTDGGQRTGDNSVLAVMAGVIALAGAAFVVTKKRK